MALEPLAAPGAAIYPQFISNTPLTLIMKGQTFSSDWSVTDISGQPFLEVDAEKMSLSHRKHLKDPRTGQEICEIRKESFSMRYKYYGVSAIDGSTVFQSETHTHMRKNETTLNFVNNAAGGVQDVLQCMHTSRMQGEIMYQGRRVATIERKRMSMSGQYTLGIAPGLDAFLVVALTVALDDRMKSQNAATSNAVAGAGA